MKLALSDRSLLFLGGIMMVFLVGGRVWFMIIDLFWHIFRCPIWVGSSRVGGS